MNNKTITIQSEQTLNFEDDVQRIKNLTRSIKTMNFSNQETCFELEKLSNESTEKQFNNLIDNSFAIDELLNIISEMLYSEKFLKYDELISNTLN